MALTVGQLRKIIKEELKLRSAFEPEDNVVAQEEFEIIDSKTGDVVKRAKNRRAANRIVDRLDNAYGGYRYSARLVTKSV